MNKKKLHIKNKGSNSIKDTQALKGAIPSMKPLGKYLGMDTFSWHNPCLELLGKTIVSFPFDLLWLGNKNEIEGFLKKHHSAENKINRCIVYGAHSDNCSNKIIYAHHTSSINHLDNITFKPGILLFTASDSDSVYSMRFLKSIFLKHI